VKGLLDTGSVENTNWKMSQGAKCPFKSLTTPVGRLNGAQDGKLL